MFLENNLLRLYSMLDKHPFPPFITYTANKLIIGTIPPHRFCKEKAQKNLHYTDVDFYYGSKDNEFWGLIGSIFNKSFIMENTHEAVQQRKNFLEENGIGITDIIESCRRENESSSDNKLEEITYSNIRFLLESHASIDTLIYTSRFVKICMNKALKTYHSIDKNDRNRKYVMINGKKYTVWILFSPSPQALRGLGKDGSIVRKEQYEQIFRSLPIADNSKI